MQRGNMKIVQIHAGLKENSSPHRIARALMHAGANPKMLVKETKLSAKYIIKLKESFRFKILRKLDHILLKRELNKKYQINENIPFSYYRVGMPIYREKLVREADLIILHWVCGTYLSVRGIKRILALNKPVLMVCHDSWFFTGGCHVRLGCKKYTEHCYACEQLKSKKRYDWSYKLFEAKRNFFKADNLTIISPSSWMDRSVAESRIFRNHKHYIIPNPIDASLYYPSDKNSKRDMYNISNDNYIMIFGAVNAVTTPYKGYRQLIAALDVLESKISENKKVEILVFGSDTGDKRHDKKIRIRYMGYLSETQMIDIYNCADVYVMPSLDDNFPCTILESLACETPVVAYDTGGICDMIRHKENGYLSKFNDPDDLAEGILWVMEHNKNNYLGKNGRKTVLEKFSEEVVAGMYLKVIEDVIKMDSM